MGPLSHRAAEAGCGPLPSNRAPPQPLAPFPWSLGPGGRAAIVQFERLGEGGVGCRRRVAGAAHTCDVSHEDLPLPRLRPRDPTRYAACGGVAGERAGFGCRSSPLALRLLDGARPPRPHVPPLVTRPGRPDPARVHPPTAESPRPKIGTVQHRCESTRERPTQTTSHLCRAGDRTLLDLPDHSMIASRPLSGRYTARQCRWPVRLGCKVWRWAGVDHSAADTRTIRSVGSPWVCGPGAC